MKPSQAMDEPSYNASMKATTNNSYAVARDAVLTQYAAHCGGANSGLFCVLFARELALEAQDALQKVAASLGYGDDGATFIRLMDPEALSDAQLYELIEGLDPLCVVCADEASARSFAQAYRTNLPFEAPARAGGRSVRAFRDFARCLGSSEQKQRAWAQLKTFPVLP